MEGEAKCHAFKAIGQALDNDVYQFQISPTFDPFRRNIKFYDCEEIPILPLIGDLEFSRDKSRWGYPFRFGFVENKEPDFKLIISKMLQNEVK